MRYHKMFAVLLCACVEERPVTFDNDPATPTEGDSLTSCQDGKDNDNDRWPDCADQDCCIYAICVDARICQEEEPLPQKPRDTEPKMPVDNSSDAGVPVADASDEEQPEPAPDIGLAPDAGVALMPDGPTTTADAGIVSSSPDAGTTVPDSSTPPDAAVPDAGSDPAVPDASSVVVALCGNGIAEGDEECDVEDFRGETCDDLGPTVSGGVLICDEECKFDTRECGLLPHVVMAPPTPGDGGTVSAPDPCADDQFCGDGPLDGSWKVVPVKVWVALDTSGTPIETDANVAARIAELNDRLGARARITFDLLPVESMVSQYRRVCATDPTVCSSCDPSFGNAQDMMGDYYEIGAFNMYIVSAGSTCAGSAGGWVYTIPGEDGQGAIVVGAGPASQHAFLQEPGHWFGLWHTHDSTEGICDTPDDPGPCWHTSPPNSPPCCDNVPWASCAVTCTPSTFAPDPGNAMGYFRCNDGYSFTDEQGAKARCVLDSTLTFLDTCMLSWSCTGWSACSCAGTQTRTCTDLNSCGATDGMPATTSTCLPCGNGACDCAETCTSCPLDCGSCPPPPPVCSCTDVDGDGHYAISCADLDCSPRDDCNNSNASIYPGAPETCNTIDSDCDGNIAEGLCGSLPNVASTSCPSGSCVIAGCFSGYGNCNGVVSDGCETNITSNVNNCSACGSVCPSRASASRTCTSGVCGFICAIGYNNCDGIASNGCETAGSCVPICIPTTEVCNGEDDDCDGLTDDLTGGVCDGPDGDLCNEGSLLCSAGAWVCGDTTATSIETCNGSDDDCDGSVDEGFSLTTDVNNCGSCGTVCPSRASASRTCVAGVCGFTCAVGYNNCDGVATNGCETAGSCVPICIPTTEVCNGEDDDCDGSVDEGFGLGASCDGPDGDLCIEGTTTCSGCSDATGTTTEVCGGGDEDCDGLIDEGLSCGCTGCTPGATETQSCDPTPGVTDYCSFTQSRTCSASCAWGLWGTCSGTASGPQYSYEAGPQCGPTICITVTSISGGTVYGYISKADPDSPAFISAFASWEVQRVDTSAVLDEEPAGCWDYTGLTEIPFSFAASSLGLTGVGSSREIRARFYYSCLTTAYYTSGNATIQGCY